MGGGSCCSWGNRLGGSARPKDRVWLSEATRSPALASPCTSAGPKQSRRGGGLDPRPQPARKGCEQGPILPTPAVHPQLPGRCPHPPAAPLTAGPTDITSVLWVEPQGLLQPEGGAPGMAPGPLGPAQLCPPGLCDHPLAPKQTLGGGVRDTSHPTAPTMTWEGALAARACPRTGPGFRGPGPLGAWGPRDQTRQAWGGSRTPGSWL